LYHLLNNVKVESTNTSADVPTDFNCKQKLNTLKHSHADTEHFCPILSLLLSHHEPVLLAHSSHQVTVTCNKCYTVTDQRQSRC